jgi:predicted MFS family arabinose efflux permease
MGLVSTGVPVGIVLALNLSGPLSEQIGWRGVNVGVALCVACAGIVNGVFWVWLTRRRRRAAARDTEAETTESAAAFEVSVQKPTSTAPRLGFGPIWLAGAIWFCASGALTSFVTFAPDRYLEFGIETGRRGLLTSLPMWMSIVLAPVVGAFVDRRERRAPLIGVGMLLMGSCFAATAAGWLGPVGLGLGLGLALAGVVTPILSLPAKLLSPSQFGRAFGILNACASAGAATLPPLAGLVRDLTGNYTGSFSAMAVSALVGATVARVLWSLERRYGG